LRLGSVDMSAADRSSLVRALRSVAPLWVWFISLAFVWGAAIVVFAFTVHNRCSEADPDCVFHSYTLVKDVGPGILGFVGAPAVISLVLVPLLHMKTARRSHGADRAAWVLTAVSCLICVLGLIVEGVVMLPAAVLTVCAVATAPFPPDPALRLD
jgi:hypothetical protein